MAHIQGEVFIRRPVEEVFDFVADERNEPTYNPNMVGSELITKGPIGVGTRFRATIRSGRSDRWAWTSSTPSSTGHT